MRIGKLCGGQVLYKYACRQSCDQAIEGMNRETQPHVIVEIGFDKALRRTETVVTEDSK